MEGLTKLFFSPNGRAGEPEGLLLMVPGALAGVPGGFRFQRVPNTLKSRPEACGVPGIFLKINKAAFELRDSGAAFGVIAKIKLI